MPGLVRTYSHERENRWHIVGENGNPLCGRSLTAGRRRQTRGSLDEVRDYQVCLACRNSTAEPRSSVRFTRREALLMHQRAEAAARKAAEEASPTPMIVGEPLNLMGSLMGTDDRIDPSKPTYRVNDGVCGFAWVTISPGNCSFARRLAAIAKERREAHEIREAQVGHRLPWPENLIRVHRGYYGGLEVWRPGYGGQSYERGMAAARAYADVLREAGINAVPGGRLD